jgi:hypothetical protein
MGCIGAIIYLSQELRHQVKIWLSVQHALNKNDLEYAHMLTLASCDSTQRIWSSRSVCKCHFQKTTRKSPGTRGKISDWENSFERSSNLELHIGNSGIFLELWLSDLTSWFDLFFSEFPDVLKAPKIQTWKKQSVVGEKHQHGRESMVSMQFIELFWKFCWMI